MKKHLHLALAAVGAALTIPAAAIPAVASAAETETTPPPPAPAALPAVEASLIAPVVRVADAARAVEFYQAVLGMRVLTVRDMGMRKETMLAFGNDPGRVAFMLVSNNAADAPPLRGLGATRLVLRVADLGAVVARLDAAGIAHSPVSPPRRGVSVLTIADPEHNELELVQKANAN